MDFTLSLDEESFRDELRAFLKTELPPDWEGEDEEGSDEIWAFGLQIRKRFAQRGWLTMHWPPEHGGQGASHIKQATFVEEFAYSRSPGREIYGPYIVGPTLMLYGTPDQKAYFLPRIARGEITWCQGFSEPGAGSDLAALATRATEEGDDFVINGQKVWTSYAHRADWMFMLARTDPQSARHRGISYFLLPMNTPGLEVRPLPNMAGVHAFNEVFFDNVRVPRKYLIGEKDQGWYVAMASLNFERSGAEYPGSCRRLVEDLVKYSRETQRQGRPLTADPILRHKLAEGAVEAQVAHWLAFQVAWLQGKGLVPDKEAAASKTFGSELLQRLTNTGLQVLGLYGQLEPGSSWAPLKGRLLRLWFYAIGRTMAGGTSEVQRLIIATRGLGLPR
ncbi:MAG: acyl-CoA dehydrogenase family protein [Chloroflexi bacterium]|nr:acyl-CoA dehydrogenase family protein [Chloroflexota bacterium]